MPDIIHYFLIEAPVQEVFEAVSEPVGLGVWWTKSSAGTPGLNQQYDLDFGPGFQWKAVATKYEPGKLFELELTEADQDWIGTRVGFILSEKEDGVMVDFYHKGWPEPNDHYRISCYCWAMYLRILKRYLEHGERVPYEERLSV